MQYLNYKKKSEKVIQQCCSERTLQSRKHDANCSEIPPSRILGSVICDKALLWKKLLCSQWPLLIHALEIGPGRICFPYLQPILECHSSQFCEIQHILCWLWWVVGQLNWYFSSSFFPYSSPVDFRDVSTKSADSKGLLDFTYWLIDEKNLRKWQYPVVRTIQSSRP